MYTPNDAIDIWVVERALGQGGMGSVYRCHNRDAKRILAAIKVLDYGLKHLPKARARFAREAEILFSLDHPHIVKVRNVRLDADPPYLEMEFVEGGSLERRIQMGPIPTPVVVLWLGQLASALAYLHDKGVRHRDLKPSNILVRSDEHVTIVDFGIATEVVGTTLSESGQAMGSVAYVPPEWVHESHLDPVKWDLYALGVCIYEALTGKTAFGVPSGGMSTQRFYQVLTAKQGHPPLDPGPDVPFGLRELVRDMTRSVPGERVATANEVLSRVKSIDPTDLRPDHAFPDSGPPTPFTGRREVDTPRGYTMVPTGPPERAAESPPVPHLPPASRGGSEEAGRIAGNSSVSPMFPRLAAALGVLALAAGFAWAVLPRKPPPDREATGVAPGATASPPPTLGAQNHESPGAPAAPVPTVPTAVPNGRLPPPASRPAIAEPASPRTAPSAAPAAAPAPTPPPDAPVAAANTSGPPVTNAQLAGFLASHPEWLPEPAVAAGKADATYLKGWTAGAPPAGKEGAAAVGVTWGLAQAYCAGHGGIAPVGAEPLKWTDSAAQPWIEYRQDDGKPRWRRDDGVTSDQVSVTQSGGFIGFRCRR